MARDLNIMTARGYINLMSARAKTELQIEHLDNVYEQLDFLEAWREKAIELLKEKENELHKRAVTIQNLSSEVNVLKNDLSALNVGLCALEEDNMRLKKMLSIDI